ncbi:uncharacterized protein BO95DRAFT_438411 [Aspergillus brunneoviolaceus CBS 621.78]|uniref:Uncharacterized protein n=1 Tax=Aspergillus brunneoviolaceus CBS 621.78 TaxID=1450534 RepID=A0ACD1GN09_9EURO|nr:hypothetical protein BO95DRAFT_438411 [Aspergillus brunneoviolaceus CBS 621.78]RAH50622.1 hypothetical protein BO95DRAFT_438411 [Aspergillus brunneoviolaceus CBS 621.78]
MLGARNGNASKCQSLSLTSRRSPFCPVFCPVSFLPSSFHLSYFDTSAKLLYFRDTTTYTLHSSFPIQCAKMSAETTIAVPPPPDQPDPTDRDVTDKEQHAAQTIQVRSNFNFLGTLSASLTYFSTQESIPGLSYAERVTRARTLAALTEHIATDRGKIPPTAFPASYPPRR